MDCTSESFGIPVDTEEHFEPVWTYRSPAEGIDIGDVVLVQRPVAEDEPIVMPSRGRVEEIIVSELGFMKYKVSGFERLIPIDRIVSVREGYSINYVL
jgi:hypothetical protein